MSKLTGAKKFFAKIGKRNLIILSAVLLVGVAVYLNYLWFYDPADSIGYGDNTASTGGEEPSGTVGEQENDYFSAVELSRKQTRDEAIEVLQSVVSGVDTDSEERENALRGISGIAVNMENEANIESLIEAKGFAQCVAVINGDKASIIVSSDTELQSAENAQICTIVYEQAGILPKDVTIIRK